MIEMNNELLTTACQRLGEIIRIEDCPLLLVFSHEWSHERGDFTGNGDFEVVDPVDKAAYQEPVGPYFPIDDLSEWSSSKFLVRAGVDPRNPLKDVMERYREKWDDEVIEQMAHTCSPQFEWWLKFQSEYTRAKRSGEDELANMLMLVFLYDHDRLAYDKGMAPLLKESV